MKARIDVITLAVRDLERAVAFYRDGLGLHTKGIVGTEFPATATDAAGAAAFFEMAGGLMLALYPRRELAKDAGLPESAPSSVEFSLGYFAESESDVDAVIARAVAAGGSPIEPPPQATLGYLLRLLPGPRRPLMGGDLEPRPAVMSSLIVA